MSKAVSALQTAPFQGFATISEVGLSGMITLRGDLSDAKLRAAVKKLTGVAVPDAMHVAMKGDKGVAWMSPDELLVLLPYDHAVTGVAMLNKALKGMHFLAENVSDARAVFRIEGEGAREVIAKLVPADVSPTAFQAGAIRRTRMAQVAAAVWMNADESVKVVCFRSTAEYVFGVLSHSACAGSEVGYF